MRKMQYPLLAVLCAALASSAFAPSVLAADKDLSGEYAMKGTSLRPNSTPYVGVCTLKLEGPAYNVNCTNTDSGDKYVGRGLQRGDMFSLYLGEYLIVYHVQGDGALAGNWAHARSNDYGEETLSPKSK
ncbi:MAG: hypothetical protein WC807_03155 [Hyphomicrobium sp.]|jgi:hypothetical protein